MMLLSLPFIQEHFQIVEEKPLFGAVVEPEKPDLSIENWFSGEFQEEYQPYYEYQIGFRPFFIRLKNQLHFWLFNKSTTYAVVGKENQLYSWDYYNVYRGNNFLGEDSIRAKVDNLVMLRDSLEVLEKPLLCVIAPNKVRSRPQYLPDHYDKRPGENSNYLSMVDELEANGLHYLDLNQWFVEIDRIVPHTLYANTSTHWSGYGMSLGYARMIERLEEMSGKDLINMNWSGIEVIDSSFGSDRDMSDLMNLLFPIQTEKLAFPQFELDNQGDAEPVKALVIGDSFFWNLYAFDEMKKIFHEDTRLWYYNKTQMDLDQTRISVSELSAHEAVQNADFVIILGTDANMNAFPYGFPEKFLNEASDSARITHPD